MELPHPAVVCSGPQLMSVIEELEAGTYPQPETAIWRGDLPPEQAAAQTLVTAGLAARLAAATGASMAQINEMIRQDEEERHVNDDHRR